MSIIKIVRRNIMFKPLQSLVACCVVMASIAMAVLVLLLADGVHSGLTVAAEPFPIVAGSKGSPNQLVLNTVFLKDTPMSNISYTEVEKLRANKNVAMAVPFGYGDNYCGFRMAGTEKEIFNYVINPQRGKWLQINEGRAFEAPFEAVLGARMAAMTGLKVGDTFKTSHGMVEIPGSKGHAQEYKVVGILKPVNGPYDQSILTDIKSIWAAHAGHGAAVQGVTGVLIKPTGYAQALAVLSQYRNNKEMQVVFPSQTIIELFSVMGDAEKVLQIISYAVILLSLIIIAFTTYWAAAMRRHDNAVMRAIGAGQKAIIKINFLQGMLLSCIGTAAGAALGHGAFAALAYLLREKTAVNLTAGFTLQEGIMIAVVVAAAAVFSFIPAAAACRRQAADDL